MGDATPWLSLSILYLSVPVLSWLHDWSGRQMCWHHLNCHGTEELPGLLVVSKSVGHEDWVAAAGGLKAAVVGVCCSVVKCHSLV